MQSELNKKLEQRLLPKAFSNQFNNSQAHKLHEVVAFLVSEKSVSKVSCVSRHQYPYFSETGEGMAKKWLREVGL